MFFDIPQGSVILFEDLGLMTQVIKIESINIQEGLGEYRVYFTYPSQTFSQAILKESIYMNHGIYGMWKNIGIYYVNMGYGAYIPNFSFLQGENVKVVDPNDLGMSQINTLSKSSLYNDYSVYGKEIAVRSLINRYKAKCLGTPLIKQIEAENFDSSHYRVYKAIQYVISSEPHKSYAAWLAKNFLYNFY